VIIPAYRAAATIARAVESVLRQTETSHEILIIDDGSPDDLAGALRPYGDSVRLIRQENGGAASARNLGIEQATGNLLAFLDADDYWEPHKLETHVRLYQRFPELGLTHSRYFEQTPADDRRLIERTYPARTGQVVRLSGAAAFGWAHAVWTGTVVVPRRVLGNNRFVSGLEPAEDRDLWVRLLVAAPAYCLQEPLATAVLEPASLSRSNVERDCGNMLRVVNRHRQMLGWMATSKWAAHTHYRWSACTDRLSAAGLHWLQSVLLWPLPFERGWVRMPFARARLLARLFRQSLMANLRLPKSILTRSLTSTDQTL
jgi:glycosyltransferase involved in cell wall biosynthesis